MTTDLPIQGAATPRGHNPISSLSLQHQLLVGPCNSSKRTTTTPSVSAYTGLSVSLPRLSSAPTAALESLAVATEEGPQGTSLVDAHECALSRLAALPDYAISAIRRPEFGRV